MGYFPCYHRCNNYMVTLQCDSDVEPTQYLFNSGFIFLNIVSLTVTHEIRVFEYPTSVWRVLKFFQSIMHNMQSNSPSNCVLSSLDLSSRHITACVLTPNPGFTRVYSWVYSHFLPYILASYYCRRTVTIGNVSVMDVIPPL